MFENKLQLSSAPAVARPAIVKRPASFSAAQDSVALLQSEKPSGVDAQEWADTRARNVEHLELVVAAKTLTAAEAESLEAAITLTKRVL